ncbi:Cof-type HAD-IIB family hydrolase [Rhodopseudomonas palustris]|uniref:Cof-type HAD-IIB family hydrolase n=1 Tax=Rhodopseudomonas palustris TaxID=1076 RepID=A0A323UA39_RHOPL|nr:Cof-type HAD-IIB family hydrolase [Rhodopseudomonas palustris]PZA09069.1 Cof-type HAD-IIB family hydrolase [Rhodopseudomonas palustris]
MTRIQLVISDVDGTLVTTDKRLTDRARDAVARLEASGVGFTLTSSRPPVGMRMYSDPLGITLPLGPFNGSSILTPTLEVIEQHLIPEAAVTTSIALFERNGIDIWLFTNDNWYIRRDDGKYVPHEENTIQFAPTKLDDLTPLAGKACKIVGVSADFALLRRCEPELQAALGGGALAVRSQDYYLDVTPPGHSKGTFVQAMAKRLGVAADAIATIGDMQNDLPMFGVSGLPIAMGNATDDVKRQAAHVTGRNDDDGFAAAIDFILDRNARLDR